MRALELTKVREKRLPFKKAYCLDVAFHIISMLGLIKCG